MLMHFNKTHEFHIPKESWDITNYRSTLGHKVNHSFKFAKAKWGYAFHPRFGDIRTVVATANVLKGEEVFTDYRYPPKSPVPKWYSDLYLKETGKAWYGDIFPKREKWYQQSH